jgi:hypothetical protein
MSKPADKQVHINFWYVVLALSVLLFVQSWWEKQVRIETVSYSEFRSMLADARFESISVSSTRIRGKLKQTTSAHPDPDDVIPHGIPDPGFQLTLSEQRLPRR